MVIKATRVLDPGFFIASCLPALQRGSKGIFEVSAVVDRQLVSSLWAMIEPVVEPEGIELVEVEFRPDRGRWLLRLYIDSPGGVTLDDCTLVSRQVSALLDIKDPIDYPYTLEVSSPGINRVLRKEKDFQRFTGSPVRLTTRFKIEGRKNFSGTLTGVQGSRIILDVNGKRVEIDRENVEKARLDIPEDDLVRRDLRRGSARMGDGPC